MSHNDRGEALEAAAAAVRALAGLPGDAPSEGERRGWRRRWTAQREGGVCATCGRDLAPGEVVFRVRLAGNTPSEPSCQGCVDAERERIARWDWLRRRFEERLRPPRPCEGCGRPVVNQGGWYSRKHTLCSERCAWTARNRRLKDARLERRQSKTCPVCGERFDGTRADQVTCSPACRQKAYRQRKGGG